MQTNTDFAVAVYDTHADAEAAVRSLQAAGFDMKKISIIGKDYRTEEHVIGYLNAGDRAKIFGKYGALWGGLMGMLIGSAVLFVPLIGHLVVLGPLAAMLVTGLEGAAAVGSASALVGALSAVGIPKDSVLRYETALKAGKFMVAVHGTQRDISQAYALLETSGYALID